MRWLSLVLVLCGLALAQTICIPPPPGSFGKDNKPLTGYSAPGLEPYDRVMTRLLEKYQIPGAALAVAKDGRLVLSRGYGWADVAAKEPVQPTSLFRLASLTKPITAVTTLHLGETLVHQGRYPNLKAFLAEKLINLLDLEPYGGKLGDPRIKEITVRDLLQHSSGWNRNAAGDPMYRPTLDYVAKAMGKPDTLSSQELLSYLMSQSLSFAPGTRWAYSNIGYAALGRVIEQLSGQTYQRYVTGLLAGMGIGDVRFARTRESDRWPGEVRYYDFPSAPLVASVIDGKQAPRPYGDFYLEAQDANGGLVASAQDLVRFVVTLEGLRKTPSPLSREALAEMLRRPSLPQYAGRDRYYALGWEVRLKDGGMEWSHDGALAGTRTLLLRLPSGAVTAAFFNSRPWNDWSFITELKSSLEGATKAVTSWPDYDCFN
jgi:N-acyl-D-amino-acid deacylase